VSAVLRARDVAGGSHRKHDDRGDEAWEAQSGFPGLPGGDGGSARRFSAVRQRLAAPVGR
jgi:hypothetical protein